MQRIAIYVYILRRPHTQAYVRPSSGDKSIKTRTALITALMTLSPASTQELLSAEGLSTTRQGVHDAFAPPGDTSFSPHGWQEPFVTPSPARQPVPVMMPTETSAAEGERAGMHGQVVAEDVKVQAAQPLGRRVVMCGGGCCVFAECRAPAPQPLPAHSPPVEDTQALSLVPPSASVVSPDKVSGDARGRGSWRQLIGMVRRIQAHGGTLQ